MINNSIIYKFFKDFTNDRNRTNRVVVFRCRPFPNILKDWDHQWNLPRIWKTRLFQALIEEFSCLKESSGSKFFRITTGIQSGPSAFDKSEFFMTSLIILGVTEILCSFRLVWEGKICRDTWVIKIRVLRKDFSKQLCFIRCRRQHVQPAE